MDNVVDFYMDYAGKTVKLKGNKYTVAKTKKEMFEDMSELYDYIESNTQLYLNNLKETIDKFAEENRICRHCGTYLKYIPMKDLVPYGETGAIQITYRVECPYCGRKY